jgi:hypothetical protein
MAASRDLLPALRLGLCGPGWEPALEPVSNSRVKQLHHQDILARTTVRGHADPDLGYRRPARSRRTRKSSAPGHATHLRICFVLPGNSGMMP